MITINEAADYLVAVSSEAGDSITNLKLQKLTYYAEAWYWALYDLPLTGAEFQAWVHGPACPELYARHRGSHSDPVPPPEVAPDLPKGTRDHLDEVLNAYGRFSAWDLECMSHAEEPWIEARRDLPPDAPCSAVISPATMRRHCRLRLA